MSKLDQILGKLNKLKRTGKDRWVACCPAHDDSTPSLSIRVTDDGIILLNCLAECEIHDVMHALNIEFNDLYPECLGNLKRINKPYYAQDILKIIANEARLIAIAAIEISNGKSLSQAEKDRILLAANRLNNGLRMSDV